jgi:hypothetical protein
MPLAASASSISRSRCCAGFLQHPAPDRHDQSGFFGERDEFYRRQHAKLRMGPAQQRLDAGDLSGRHVHLRLIMQRELISLQRAA